MSGRIVSEVRNGPELSLSGDYADESTGSPGKQASKTVITKSKIVKPKSKSLVPNPSPKSKIQSPEERD